MFALHYVAFMYLLTIGAGAAHRLGLSTDLAAMAGYTLLAPYLMIAMRRVYAEPIGLMLLKAAALMLLVVSLNGLANFVAIPPHPRARMMVAEDRKSVLWFLALTFGISAMFWGRSFGGAPLNSVVPFLMWTPGVCVIATQLLFHRPVANLGWRSGPLRYLALSVLLPLIYCVAIYVPVWVFGAGQFDRGFLPRALPLLPFALVQNVFFALGEEIGWRSFLVPALYRVRGFAGAGGASGLIWASGLCR